MLTAQRSLALNVQGSMELPRVAEMEAVYRMGVRPRHGEVVMIVGRSGTQKSGFALWWTASMNLPTLYFSADMSAFTASARLASMYTGDTTDQVEAGMSRGGRERDRYLEALQGNNVSFSFGSPITWRSVEEEIDAYVELWDAYPQVIVLDNLMDFQGAEADYTVLTQTMSSVTELARDTGATVMVLHHATDKSWDAKGKPFEPPARSEVKYGLAEKPELTLSVALNPYTYLYKVACIKARMGPCDPTGQRYASLRAFPEITRFGLWVPQGTSSWTPSSALED